MTDLTQSTQASIDAAALSMEQLHLFTPCTQHPGCCIVADGPFVAGGPLSPPHNHVQAWKPEYTESERAARSLVRHYAVSIMERDYRSRGQEA